jgi:hypothetical protein
MLLGSCSNQLGKFWINKLLKNILVSRLMNGRLVRLCLVSSVIFTFLVHRSLGGKECPGVIHLPYSAFPDPQHRYLDLKNAILNFNLIPKNEDLGYKINKK